jgi:glycosyltransferase involved in cell wall biosynthesis
MHRPSPRSGGWYASATDAASEVVVRRDVQSQAHAELATQLLTEARDGEAQSEASTGRPRISVVIPAMNEERNLPFVLPNIGSWVDEVILVDGGSTDGTRETAQSLLPDVRIVEQDGKGKGSAQLSGFEAATGDIIVSLDADGSMNPEELPAFVGALASGAEVAKGTRYIQGAGSDDLSHVRSVGNRCLTWTARRLYGGRLSDITYGYVAFWRNVLQELDLRAEGFELEVEITVQAMHRGMKVVEVPCFEARRVHGTSNLHAMPDGWRILKLMLRERFLETTRLLRRKHVDASTT